MNPITKSIIITALLTSCGQGHFAPRPKAHPTSTLDTAWRAGRSSYFDPHSSLNEKLERAVTRHFARGTQGSLKVSQKTQIHYRVFTVSQTRDAIVILPGYSESSETYDELIYDLNLANYSVYVMDHRGMGRSSREVLNPQVVHIREFSTYVADVELFLNTVVGSGPEKNRFLIAHSTGGLIAANVIKKRPQFFKKIVLSAPLFELETGSYGSTTAYLTASILDELGRGTSYAPGFKDFDFDTDSFDQHKSTSDRTRYTHARRHWEKSPELVMGGPSVRWVKEVLRNTSTHQILELGKANRRPTLLLQAGIDHYVRAKGQHVYCSAAKDCTIVHFEHSRHSLLREQSHIRSQALNDIFSFLQSE